MTKKDYEIVGAVIATTGLSPTEKIRLVDQFCDAFIKGNPHFKRDLFEKASGVFSCSICKKNGGSFRTTDLSDSKAHFLIHLNNES